MFSSIICNVKFPFCLTVDRNSTTSPIPKVCTSFVFRVFLPSQNWQFQTFKSGPFHVFFWVTPWVLDVMQILKYERGNLYWVMHQRQISKVRGYDQTDNKTDRQQRSEPDKEMLVLELNTSDTLTLKWTFQCSSLKMLVGILWHFSQHVRGFILNIAFNIIIVNFYRH